jgi:biotin operon repressor
MSLLKSIDRLKKLDSLIKKEFTGTAEEFAEKIGISRSMLMINLDEMREMGAQIKFNPIRKTYYYEQRFDLLIGNMVQVKGGNYTTIEILYLHKLTLSH